MKVAVRLIALLLAAVYFSPGTAFAAAGDYDGDGLSDLAVAEATANGSVYKVRLSSTGEIRTYNFSSLPFAYTPGSYYVPNIVTPGVTSQQYYMGVAIYKWLSYYEGAETFYNVLGMSGEAVVPADYDCDGITDLATTSTEADTRRWTLALSLSRNVDEIVFGNASDRAFGADVNGDGCAELITVRSTNGQFVWKYRTPAVDQVSTLIFGALGDIPLRPADLNGDGRPDFVVVRSIGGIQNAIVRYGENSIAAIPLGPDGTITLTGNFLGYNYFAFYNRTAHTFTLKNAAGPDFTIPLGTASSAVVRPDGSSVSPGQDDRIVRDNADGTSGGGGPAIPADPLRCDSYYKPSDGNANFVHNPKTSKGKFKMVLPSGWTGQVKAIRIAAKRKVIDNMKYAYGYEYGYRERWYSSKAPSKYPKNIIEIVEFHTHEQICIKIPNPKNRYD